MSQGVKKVGFIGLGDLGLPMAKNIITRGYSVTVCGHRRREPIDEMKQLGAKEVSTPKEVAKYSEVVFTCLRDDDDTGRVVFGSNGIMEGISEGSAIILLSTLTPDFCIKVAEEARAKGTMVLDAPVIGRSLKSAITGEGLSILVGGEEEVVEKYRPMLETMGEIVYCGGLGRGQLAKLADNMAGITMGAMLVEAVAWGLRNGLDEDKIIEVMRRGSSRGWALENWKYVRKAWSNPRPTPSLGAKDISYALKLGLEVGASCPIAAAACEVHKAAQPKLPIGPKK
ncbi:NAD(P)-dependent oxidoreductase [Chloroflexota bacterium]